MKRRVVLLIILFIAIICAMSLFSLLLYFDPYDYKILAIILLLLSFFGSAWWILTLILYFIKKIYFRWDIWMFHILSSLRQAVLTCVMIWGIVYIISLWIPAMLPIILLMTLLMFFELFIQNL